MLRSVSRGRTGLPVSRWSPGGAGLTNMTALWAIRLLFLSMCIMGGYAISQVRPEYVGGSYAGPLGMVIGRVLRA